MFNLRPVLHPDDQAGLDFKDKVTTGFEVSLKTGVDILVAMTSVLVKLGKDFDRLSSSRRSKSRGIPHPAVMLRMAGAFLRSKLAGRSMLPRDLWPVKAVIGWGIDTPIYRELVRRYNAHDDLVAMCQQLLDAYQHQCEIHHDTVIVDDVMVDAARSLLDRTRKDGKR